MPLVVVWDLDNKRPRQLSSTMEMLLYIGLHRGLAISRAS